MYILLGAILCIQDVQQQFLASTHQMPVATYIYPLSCDSQKWLQTLPAVKSSLAENHQGKRRLPSLVAQTVKHLSVYNEGDPGSIPGLGRSPGEGNSNPLQDYCLENPMDRGAWQATAHGVTKSRTQLNDFTFSLSTVQYSKQSPLPLDHENLILLNFVNFSAPWQYPNLFVLDMLNLFLGTE